MKSRLSRDLVIFIALLVLIAGFSVYVAQRRQEVDEQAQTDVRFSTHSAAADGTRALYDWLGRLGYRVERIENRAFEITDNVSVLFMLSPLTTVEDDQATYILRWVERGNTLILADERNFFPNRLYRELGMEFDSLADRADSIPLSQPLIDSASGEIQTSTFNALELEQPNFAAFAVSEGKPLFARITRGSGVVWALSTADVFSNEKLRDEDNARFAAALVANTPRDRVIAFDEYHLGFQPEYTNDFIGLLYDTPWGWGILFTIIAFFAYFGLGGQRLGRVLPVPKTLARRSPSEYVISMANLFRRANKRGMVLQHYRHSLKRRLGRPYHLSPDLADERYVEMLERLRPDLDRNELVNILNSLRRTDTTEADLVKTIEKSVTFGGRGASQ